MRWYFESPDSTQYLDILYEDGVATITAGPVDGEADSVEELAFADQEALAAVVMPRIKEKVARGWAAAIHPDERFQQEPTIGAYWENRFLDELFERCDGSPRDEPLDYGDRMIEYMAVEPPTELVQFLKVRSEWDLGYADFGEWRIWDEERWLPDPEQGNLFEQLVLMDQNNYLGTALLEYLANYVFLGTAGNGDAYFGHPNFADPGQCEVVFWDHETQRPEFVFADSISSFAWTNHLYCRLDDEDFDHDRFVEDAALIADRVNFSWHYGRIADEASIEPEYESKSRAIYYAYRAQWLNYLLRNNGVVEVDDCGAMFWPDLHAPLKFEDAEGGPYLKSSTITGLYWLWRLWFFNKKDPLRRCLEVLHDHRSPIVRDAAELVEELEDGRRELGTIEDMHALRQQWLDLDIDPDRAEERAREEAEAARREQEELARNLEEAHQFLSDASVEEVRDALWDWTDSPQVLDVLYEHLEHHDPSVKPWLDRWKFFDEQGASRDGKFFSFEVDQLQEVMAREGGVIAPRFFATPRGTESQIAAAKAAGERVRPRLMEMLDQRSKYFTEVWIAVEGLAALGASEIVDDLLGLVEELKWDESDFAARIEREQAFGAVIEAIGELGGRESLETLTALATEGPDEIAPRAMIALGRIGEPSSVETLIELLDSDHGRPAAWALARIEDDAAVTALEDHVGQFAGAPEEFAYERVMLQRAYLTHDREVDYDIVVWGTTVIESKKWEDIELHESLVELLAGWSDDRAENLLRDYLHHQYPRVRDAAIEALRERGELEQLRWLDRPTTDRLFQEEGTEGLRDALVDDHAIFRVNVLRKAVDEGVTDALAEEACAFVEFLTRFEHYTNGYAQDVHEETGYAIRALAQFENDAADRVLCGLFLSGNAMYAKPFQYAEELRDRVLRFEDEFGTEAEDDVTVLHATRLADSPWLFGALINGMAWSPEGDVLAVAGEGGVTIFDDNGQPLRTMESISGGWIYDVDFHPQERAIAIGAHAGHLRLLDVDSGEEIRKLRGHAGVPNGVRKVRFSPDGKHLASVSDDQTLRIWDVESGECDVVHGDPADVNSVDWFDDERLVIATDRMTRLMSREGTEIASVSTGPVAEVRVTPDRAYVYVGGSEIRVFDREFTEVEDATLGQNRVARLRFTPDGEHLFAASWEGEDIGVSKWNLAERTRERLPGHDDASVFGMDLRPDAELLAAGGRHSTVYRWTSDGELLEHDDVFHTGEIGGIRRQGEWLLTAGDDGTVIRWSLTGDAVAVYEAPEGQILTDATADLDRGRLYVSGFDFAGAYDLESAELLWDAVPRRSEHLERVDDAVVLASYDTLLWLDPEDGSVLHQSDSFADSFIYWWARLDDRRLAVAGYDDPRLFIWDLVDRERVDTWELPASDRGKICAIDVAPDTGKLFVARWNKSVLILDTASGDVVKRAALDGARMPLAVTPDGSAVITAVGTRLDVHDPETFEVTSVIEVPSGLECLAVDDDGRLFGGAKSGEVYVASIRS